MRKLVYLLLVLLLGASGSAQSSLSDNARISILTSSPYDEEVFTVYGHAAIRVADPDRGRDLVFNYGLFDFSKSDFICRFVKGETDYMLGAVDFRSYVIEYQMRGSAITEQVLNLTTTERERLWQALLLNYQPENRVYRYNFFFDNCATRPVALVEKSVDGQVVYHDPPAPLTFRAMINHCTRNHDWLTFGCDLALGSPTDREATAHQMMFLPDYLKAEFAKATIQSPDGTTRPLVLDTRCLAEADAEAATNDDGFFTPLVCALVLLVLVALLTGLEWRWGRWFWALDGLLFLAAGAGGVILFFLAFLSVHPCTWPNWWMIWLHPFHLLAVGLFSVKKRKKAAYSYHFINFAALTLMLMGWYFIPQHLHAAGIPLVATWWLRSGAGIYRLKEKPAKR